VSTVISLDLFLNALTAGVLLGGFYAAVSLGIALAFGLLDIVNIAHPVFVMLGSYVAYIMNLRFGLDPILTGLLFTPVFYALGVLLYRVYYASFERKGAESLRGLVFFFGVLFIVEVSLLLAFGVDYRMIEARYIGETFHIGPVGIAFRLLVPCVVGVAMTGALYLFLSRTFYGRAIQAVAQDSFALRLMGANPFTVKDVAFGLAIATAALAGALLIMIGPVEPAMNREYIGRVFAVAVLGGMGSIGGTLVAALILGIVESLTSTFYGPSWGVAVSFGVLLLALAVRPSGLFGR
jgi:branched-chain amino acid transport system permease protein